MNLENMSNEQLINEVKYLNALIQTLVSKNAELTLNIANYETQARLNKDNEASDE
ncbi:hypothetical protein [Staphylococcus pseudintermedius]|uniref:ORF097 n=1 Tax=Staphylococcus phage 2638A TaxID=320836 RepID=Q4ZD62_BP263|nr:hypothetical protein [Staphylococcus pseudintermedius]YP_239814.1 ORF097 [Staphylococcus phage 2638A]AAX91041.1 ORF097 [Staphylococcus phage 2638A]EHL7191140.1 hypothetical protein [Staphylococcus pseudintermedius]EHV5278626.1 hypothetical protein [Staphylococcus pseudintermedius]EII2001890.1 hypothetical protein [Staphylococcus pseudintermedius]EIK0280736.1 hypothetical protein [Staphylococcus pseudintermedius]